jgi:hypothetical protein
MIAETLSQNPLVIPSNYMTLQLYKIEYIDNRITNKFIKDTEYYLGCNHKKFTDFIDTLLSFTANILKIKDFVMKDYNSYDLFETDEYEDKTQPIDKQQDKTQSANDNFEGKLKSIFDDNIEDNKQQSEN